jgi:single-stranded DNA-specific DHH superfamily exonuclease
MFMMNAFIGDFTSNHDRNEYFYVTERFFDSSSIAAELVQAIEENGNVTLRTDYELDDEAFAEIANEVIRRLGTADVFGFHWLGVIWMGYSGR